MTHNEEIKFFPFYRSFEFMIDDLNGDQLKELLHAWCKHYFNGEEPEIKDELVKFAFNLSKPSMDKYLTQIINAKKGGRPRKTETPKTMVKTMVKTMDKTMVKTEEGEEEGKREEEREGKREGKGKDEDEENEKRFDRVLTFEQWRNECFD